MKRIPLNYAGHTEEELLNMTKAEATEGLLEKHQRFCECYIESHNYKIALLKAGYQSNHNSSLAGRLLMNEKIQRYVCWLKLRVLRQHMVNAYDLIDEWIRIAFSDMTDFVDIYPNSIKLKPADQVDGQLIKSIKSGRDGVSIEFHDKMRALDKLADYCDDLPKGWKQKLEERKQELLEQEFELKKKAMEFGESDKEDDGFIEAIKKSAEKIWENE